MVGFVDNWDATRLAEELRQLFDPQVSGLSLVMRVQMRDGSSRALMVRADWLPSTLEALIAHDAESFEACCEIDLIVSGLDLPPSRFVMSPGPN